MDTRTDLSETSEISASDANEVLIFDGPTTSASYVRCADERADAFDRPKKRETSVSDGDEKTDARSDRPKFCEISVRFEEQKTGTRSDRTKKREHFVRYGEKLSNCPKKFMLVTEMKERAHAPIAILLSSVDTNSTGQRQACITSVTQMKVRQTVWSAKDTLNFRS